MRGLKLASALLALPMLFATACAVDAAPDEDDAAGTVDTSATQSALTTSAPCVAPEGNDLTWPVGPTAQGCERR